MLRLTVPITPVPASRPRVTRWGTYYGKRYKEWLKNAAELLGTCTGTPIDQPVRAELLFAIPRSKTGKLTVPTGDGDNYEKAILDVIQHSGHLMDDRLITTLTWRKRFIPYGTEGSTTLSLTPETEEIELLPDK